MSDSSKCRQNTGPLSKCRSPYDQHSATPTGSSSNTCVQTVNATKVMRRVRGKDEGWWARTEERRGSWSRCSSSRCCACSACRGPMAPRTPSRSSVPASRPATSQSANQPIPTELNSPKNQADVGRLALSFFSSLAISVCRWLSN